jgi:DUF971 family protein
MKTKKRPTDIVLHTRQRTLEVSFADGECFLLTWEYLRVFSPSKEVRGRHGKDRILVTGKQDVVITDMQPVGNYAIKILFDDGHDSGLYDWDFLYELGALKADYWKQYQDQLAAIAEDREF